MAEELQLPVFQLHFDSGHLERDSGESSSHSSIPAKKIKHSNKSQMQNVIVKERNGKFNNVSGDLVFDTTEPVYDSDSCSQFNNDCSSIDRSESRRPTISPPDTDYHKEGAQKYNSFSEVLREVGQESKMVVLQYSQTFGDIENYEHQGIQAISDLKAHADILYQNLISQRKLFCDHLKKISDTLKPEF